MDQAAPVEHHGTGRQRTRGVDKMRVLVVEDESDIAGLVKHTLERSATPSSKWPAAATRR